jgi:hypothetical protein
MVVLTGAEDDGAGRNSRSTPRRRASLVAVRCAGGGVERGTGGGRQGAGAREGLGCCLYRRGPEAWRAGHARLEAAAGAASALAMADGPRWAGGLGRRGRTGSGLRAQPVRNRIGFLFFLFFRNIFQCIRNSRKSPENTLKHEK